MPIELRHAEQRRGAASDTRLTPLETWELVRTPPGSVSTPDAMTALDVVWQPAMAPGTVASALQDMGAWDWTQTEDLDASDWWFRCRFAKPSESGDTVLGTTAYVLRFDGLATVADVWLNGTHILRSDNMFVAHEIDVTAHLHEANDVLIRFGSLRAELAVRRPRARWRTRMTDLQQIRWIRTTLIGRMPGWSASPQPVGPWRPVTLEARPAVNTHTMRVQQIRVQPRVDGTDGVVDVEARWHVPARGAVGRVPPDATLVVGDAEAVLTCRFEDDVLVASGTLRIANVDLWWPHTHGIQPLYTAAIQVTANADGTSGSVERTVEMSLGCIGFRDVVLDTMDDGFTIRVNGTRIFCRGACWSLVDVVRLAGTPDGYREALMLARDAGMNMLRVGGTMIYEADAFYDLCDELGILVWQDFMFANMDYPASDETFVAQVRTEATQFLGRIQGRPCLALLCGNSEISQQASMLGLPREQWTSPLFETMLPGWCRDLRPDVPYWPSSPSGGAFPFHSNAGDAHYFGYGAYLRDANDVRLADVRFASECLALANVPEHETIDLVPGGVAGAGHHPAWKAAVPRDNGASWDFEDVRDHYVEQFFNVRAPALRYADSERYLALGRVASGEVIARAIGEWRRARSSCAGALIWFYRDLRPGAGWGIVDSTGRPKAAYYYMRRACQPVAISVADEGLNGLRVSAVNDTALPVDGELRVTLYRQGHVIVATGTTELPLPARRAVEVQADALFEGFLDMSYAYRFGPPAYDVLVATLTNRATGVLLSEAVHFSASIPASRDVEPGITAVATPVEDGCYQLEVSSERYAHAVAIDVERYRPVDNYFPVPPGATRVTLLRPLENTSTLRGSVLPLNASAPARIVIT